MKKRMKIHRMHRRMQTFTMKNGVAGEIRRTEALRRAAAWDQETLFAQYRTGPQGLTADAVAASRAQHGANVLAAGRRESAIGRVLSAWLNPFTAVLLALAGISAVTDILCAPPSERSCATVVIIAVMVLLSGLLRFVQETRSGQVTERLSRMIPTTAAVLREGVLREIPMEELVVGDLVSLAAGDMIPADLRILSAKDLFLSQSALTGESEPVERCGQPDRRELLPAELRSLALMGGNVVSGSAQAVVVAVGRETLLGAMAGGLQNRPSETAFDKGVGAVSRLLIRFMLAMVPVVFFLNGMTKGNWMQALLFAISIAVGLTPEMLPMIVTAALARGALAMSRQKVVIHQLGAIQNLGAIDLLCTDKTGTLTQDRVVLEYHLNVDGEEDDRVLRHAFLNSYFQTGLRNLIDRAVIERQQALGAEALIRRYTKVDEIPFDFERRRMSVVVADERGKTQLVTKGAVEEMLACCSYAECGGAVRPLTEDVRRLVRERADALGEGGMRVIAVAQKTHPAPAGAFRVEDECAMVLIGFLAFLDPPKESARAAVEALKRHGVAVKVLTGDNERVTRTICRQVGLHAGRILLGEEIERMDDRELARLAESQAVFAKLAPAQKARIIRLLQEKGHCVGFMGDGINDAAALQAADVGISVDTAVDIARESASVVLLEKDLRVLEQGVLEGRKTYVRMIQYIRMTASSNFGNVLSVLAASAFLPFLPMTALQLLMLGLIYDITCMALPWDRVEESLLRQPRRWDAAGLGRMMFWLGPLSSLFDLAGYLLLYFWLCPRAVGAPFARLSDPAGREAFVSLFQTGWFVLSMWTQTLAIHLLRTPGLPGWRSRASLPVLLLSALGMGTVTLLPFLPAGEAIGLCPLPAAYFPLLAAVLLGYLLAVTAVKRLYVRRYGAWL